MLVDYGGPNVAKEMHVGHLRASIIGEAIKRLYRFRGDEVLGDAHFGDWGFQMGLLIIAVLDEDPAAGRAAGDVRGRPERGEPRGRARAASRTPSRSTTSTGSIRRPPRGPRSTTAYRDRARRATAELQAGRLGYRLLWRALRRR